MPDPLEPGAPGSGFDSPDPGAALNPNVAGSVTSILPASTHLVNTCNKGDGTATLPIFGADTMIVQTYAAAGSYPTSTLTVQYSADGYKWESSGVTITAAGFSRLDASSGTPVGYRFARVTVTTAASGSEQLVYITVTALKTGA